MTTNGPVVIFDLDGTLVDGNSFHILIRRLVLGPSPKSAAMLPTRLIVSVLAALRVCRLYPRRAFKRYVHSQVASKASTSYLQRVLQSVVAELSELTRPDVRHVLEACQSRGSITVLATGAMHEYAELYAERLGLDVVVSTKATGVGWVETIGAAKRDMTMDALRMLGSAQSPRILIADHSDDWELADECDICLWLDSAAIRGQTEDVGFSIEAFECSFASLCG